MLSKHQHFKILTLASMHSNREKPTRRAYQNFLLNVLAPVPKNHHSLSFFTLGPPPKKNKKNVTYTRFFLFWGGG